MRKINKRQPLPAFTAFKEKNPSANWDTLHEEAHKPIFNDARDLIVMEEQNCLCGYTEIPFEEMIDASLDHFRKRATFPKLIFDWDNLIAATRNDDFGANYNDNKYKIKQNEYNCIFNPVEDAVENYFEYNYRGEIIPKHGIDETLKDKVKKTIEVFNLNHKKLVNRRMLIIKQIDNYSDSLKANLRAELSHSGFVSVVNQYTKNIE
jgi:uncharacterized protein (TIGR02646 family)